MYGFKRIIAYFIDCIIILVIISLVNGVNIRSLVFAFVQGIVGFEMLSPYALLLTGVLPIVINGIMIGQLGWTPGKRLMNLRAHNAFNMPIGIGKGILREAIKCAAISFLLFGLAWALYGIFHEHRTFYDRWLDLSVDDVTPAELTDTQQKWRDYHGE